MIEQDRFPVILRMAGLAFLSVRPVMFIIFLVTGKTI